MNNLFCFVIKTFYNSGKISTEDIISANEDSMWKYYNKHHNKKKISKTIIVNAFEVYNT